jgi:Putative addiction module component
MNARTKTVLDEARKLSPKQQLELIEELLAGVDISADDPDADLLLELDARWQAFERGEDKGQDAFEAIGEIRASIKSRGTP